MKTSSLPWHRPNSKLKWLMIRSNNYIIMPFMPKNIMAWNRCNSMIFWMWWVRIFFTKFTLHRHVWEINVPESNNCNIYLDKFHFQESRIISLCSNQFKSDLFMYEWFKCLSRCLLFLLPIDAYLYKYYY